MSGSTLYELWLAHGADPVGLWVMRDSWRSMVARVVFCGPLTGPPPYYGNPNPEVRGICYRLNGVRMGLQTLTCAGTYAYRRVDAPAWAGVVV